MVVCHDYLGLYIKVLKISKNYVDSKYIPEIRSQNDIIVKTFARSYYGRLCHRKVSHKNVNILFKKSMTSSRIIILPVDKLNPCLATDAISIVHLFSLPVSGRGKNL